MKKFILLTPLLILFIISGFLLYYLIGNKDPLKPPSALLNKDIPKFKAINLYNENEIITNSDLSNKYVLINFFASWCAPCKIEHPLLFEIKKDIPELYLLGISHKDKPNDTINYLVKERDPYTFVVIDVDGMIGFDFGVFGLPETFLINDKGKVIFKHLGPLTKKVINDKIKPLL